MKVQRIQRAAVFPAHFCRMIFAHSLTVRRCALRQTAAQQEQSGQTNGRHPPPSGTRTESWPDPRPADKQRNPPRSGARRPRSPQPAFITRMRSGTAGSLNIFAETSKCHKSSKQSNVFISLLLLFLSLHKLHNARARVYICAETLKGKAKIGIVDLNILQ